MGLSYKKKIVEMTLFPWNYEPFSTILSISRKNLTHSLPTIRILLMKGFIFYNGFQRHLHSVSIILNVYHVHQLFQKQPSIVHMFLLDAFQPLH